MDALQLLKHDHDDVKELLEQLDKTDEDDTDERRELFDKLSVEMRLHEAIEEDIFYPALREHAEAREIVLEGYEEHHVVNELLEEMAGVPLDDETWGAKASVMKENLEHHIEEEEGEMFEKAREIFDESDLDRLGEAMQQHKQEKR